MIDGNEEEIATAFESCTSGAAAPRLPDTPGPAAATSTPPTCETPTLFSTLDRSFDGEVDVVGEVPVDEIEESLPPSETIEKQDAVAALEWKLVPNVVRMVNKEPTESNLALTNAYSMFKFDSRNRSDVGTVTRSSFTRDLSMKMIRWARSMKNPAPQPFSRTRQFSSRVAGAELLSLVSHPAYSSREDEKRIQRDCYHCSGKRTSVTTYCSVCSTGVTEAQKLIACCRDCFEMHNHV